MASSSSNRHWPSMFRSKHAASQPWQPQPDMGNTPPSLVSGSSTTTGCTPKSIPFSSGGSEERSPDPKPRWNPRPEQIRILEAIFNSGMVNPPRDEIPRIRMQLQEYGQVGDANVFYWFQNRKSRSKNKLRAAAGRAALTRACAPAREAAAPFTPPPPPPQQVQPQQLLVLPVAPTSSSSSSSDRSSGSSRQVKPAAQPMSATAAMDLLSPLAATCHQQMHYHGQPVAPAPAAAPKVQELVATDEPIFLQWPQGHCLSAAELAAILGAQYMHVPVQQPPPASPTGMFLGLCNEVAAEPTTTGHGSDPWGAGLGQYWPSGADQLVLGKSSAASNTAVARQEAHEDATKLGLLQYGFGVSAPAVDATSPAAALLPAASPDAAVTVASLAASTTANGTGANNQLQGPADVGFTGAAPAPATTGTVAVARGVAVVCIAGTSAVYTVPATHLDVVKMFGEAAVLFHCNGEPVLVDEFGLTVEPLQQGAVYCVLI